MFSISLKKGDKILQTMDILQPVLLTDVKQLRATLDVLRTRIELYHMLYQNVKIIVKGNPCKVRVANHSGDDILTTYDHGDVATVDQANMDVAAFFNACVDEFKLKNPSRPCKPNMFVRPKGEQDMTLVTTADDGKVHDLDLSLFEEVLIQPVPLAGG